MNPGFVIPESELPSLLDRLVCGELDETARRHLLAWLEAEPPRWRLCGLAFLEAQAWSHAFGELPRSDHDHLRDTVQPTHCPTSKTVPRQRGTRAFHTLGLVALSVAFGLGLAVRDVIMPQSPPRELHVSARAAPQLSSQQSTSGDRAANGGGLDTPSRAEPVLAALELNSEAGFDDTSPIHIPVMPASANSVQGSPQTAEIPDYVRQQWERRGYKISFERRYLFARLPDGQQVVVPVEELDLNPTSLQIN
jgi:hypothetical protein